jgi:hypothetical protein
LQLRAGMSQRATLWCLSRTRHSDGIQMRVMVASSVPRRDPRPTRADRRG